MSTLPRNLGLPAGISLLRQLHAQANPETINLGLGKPEEDMPSALRALALPAIADSKLDYTENAGDLSLREQLATRFELTSGKNLILTHGAQEALMAALMAVLNPGDEVLLPDPGFLAYAPMVKMLGAKPVFYSLKVKNSEYVHDLPSIQKKITTRTRVILLSSPANPTGADLSETFLHALLKIIERKKIIILSDEVYGLLHFSKSYLPLAATHERIISVSSFSKSHALTGWRLGFLACPEPALLQACLIAHQYLATCASVPAQRLLSAVFKNKLFEKIPHDYAIRYQNKLELFIRSSSESLRENIPHACGGFYLFPKLPKKISSLAFCEKLLQEKNVLAIPGIAFGKNGEGSIRLSLALPDGQIKKAAKILSTYY